MTTRTKRLLIAAIAMGLICCSIAGWTATKVGHSILGSLGATAPEASRRWKTSLNDIGGGTQRIELLQGTAAGEKSKRLETLLAVVLGRV
jgi:hypothetical protein